MLSMMSCWAVPDPDEPSSSDSSSDGGSESAPRTDTDTSGLSSSSSGHERLYRGSPTRTELIRADKQRVSKKRLCVEVPATTNMKQASNGKVKAFHPDPYGRCCKRGCCKYFLDAKNLQLIAARKPLYDETLSRPAMRDVLQRNAINFLRNPDDGLPVCNKMVTQP